MSASNSRSPAAIGFLTVTDAGEHGLFGGYLLLNSHGRPLEFHCTAPVTPNRAQQILYGPTLAPYLYGERIGQTLLASAKVKPLWVCTNVAPALASREFTTYPLALIAEQGAGEAADETGRPRLGLISDDTPGKSAERIELVSFALGEAHAACRADYAPDQHEVLRCWREHFSGLDLAEPFGRIREAIEEARRGAA